MKHIGILAIYFIVLFMSCGSTNVNEQATAMEKQNQTDFEILIQNEFGGPKTPQIHVIKEPKSLAEFYGIINRTRKPGFAIPKIDFKKEMVVVLCMGEKRSAGHSIEISKIQESDNTVTISVQENKPEDMSSQVITSPFCIIKMPATSKELVFEKP